MEAMAAAAVKSQERLASAVERIAKTNEQGEVRQAQLYRETAKLLKVVIKKATEDRKPIPLFCRVKKLRNKRFKTA